MSKIAPAFEKVFRIELLRQLRHGQQFFALGNLDEEQAEEVHERFRQVTESGVIGDRGRVLALRQLRLVGVAHQRQMHEDRRFKTEILIDQDVLRNGGEPFLAACDMRDLHQMVVDDVRHVIGRHAVGLEQHLHVDGFPRYLHVAIDAVAELAGTLGGYLHTHDMRLAGGYPRSYFLGREAEAETVIFRRLAGGPLRLAHLLQPLRRAEAAEAVAVCHDLFDIGLIDVLAVALAIGAAGAANIGTFRPFQPAPFQCVEHFLLEFGRRARRIRVLDAQNKFAAVLLGEEIVEERDISGADMRLAGGGRCDTHPDCRICHCLCPS